MMKQYLRSIPIIYKTYGFMQYLWYHYSLSQAQRCDRANLKDQNGINYPPATLRWRVHGAFDLNSFIQVGMRDCEDIITLLAQINYKLTDFNHILDFGSGCGRVLRHLSKQTGKAAIYGTDIDNEAINWCRENLADINFNNNPFSPPSQFSDNQFDFIYAISVFTHLDEDLQFVWLNELKRIVRPGGIILLTVHGPTCYRQLPKPEQDAIESNGFLFRVSQTGKLKVDGLPDFYQTTYHSKSYVEREWGNIFKILGYIEQGINDHQDAILLSK